MSFLIDTLHYSLRNPRCELVFIPESLPDAPFSGVTVTHMTDGAYITIESSKISFIGYRVPSDPARGFDEGQYLQQCTTIQTTSGTMSMMSLYADPGGTFVSTVSGCTYMVLNGSGTYAYAKSVRVTYNQDLTRVVEVYGDP